MDILKLYPTLHPQTAGRVIDNEAVLMLADSSELNVLNTVASHVFELADGAHSVAEIVDSVVSSFEVDRERAESDVVDFLREMVDRQVFALSESKGNGQ